MAKEGRLGNLELKTDPDTPILIDIDVDRVFSGPDSNHVFFTKLDGSVWSFGLTSQIKEGLKEVRHVSRK